MNWPRWWEFALLSLAVFRIWKLLAEDTILDRPRAWLLKAGGWRPDSNQAPPRSYREHLATFITCPWCAGFWLSIGVWVLWLCDNDLTSALAVPWAISAVVGLLGQHLT